MQKCMHLIGAYCAIQSGAYTFGTTKLAPQIVVVMACLVTREFDTHKKDTHFAKLPTLEHNFWQCVVHLPWFCDHLAEVVSKSMPKNGTRFRDARIAKVTKLPKLDFGCQIIRKTLLFWRVDFEKSHFQNYRFLIKSLYMSIGILSKNHWFLHFRLLSDGWDAQVRDGVTRWRRWAASKEGMGSSRSQMRVRFFFSDPKDLDQKVRVTPPPLFRPLLTKFWTSFLSLLARVVGAAR